MSYEIAGRISWFVNWIDHWRGPAHAVWKTRLAQRSQPRTETSGLQNVSHDISSDDALISQTLAAKHLRESVEQLPSHERQVLLLHVNNGLTYWEIAARLGMDEEVVLKDLAHAYSQLRLELSANELRR